MAAAGAAEAPSPPEPSLGELISAALARSGRVRAAADAVIYLHFGAIWAGTACFFPTTLARGSALANAAARVQVVAMFLGILLAPFALVLYALRLAGSNTEATKPPRHTKDVSVSHDAPGGCCFGIVAMVLQGMKREVLILAAMVCVPFMVLPTVGFMLDGGSHEEGRIGGLLVDVGTLGVTVVQVFIFYPTLASRLWRVECREKRATP
ncbi:hypothetical protein ACP70R_047573 [Stipagrostis hirtigluma subsp. patula]